MEVFFVVTALWIFSVCLHEFGHAIVAYYGGDHTVAEKGYLTFNPLRYTHPVYSLAMPVLFMLMGGIGLPGGAVYIERERIPSRWWQTSVSLAGPASHLPMILLISLAFNLGWLANDPRSLASVSLGFILELQVSAILLNLIPVPPLDGFQAIAPWLREDTRERMFAASGQTGLIFFLVLCFVEPVNEAFWKVVWFITGLLGVDPYLGYLAFKTFRFWEN